MRTCIKLDWETCLAIAWKKLYQVKLKFFQHFFIRRSFSWMFDWFVSTSYEEGPSDYSNRKEQQMNHDVDTNLHFPVGKKQNRNKFIFFFIQSGRCLGSILNIPTFLPFDKSHFTNEEKEISPNWDIINIRICSAQTWFFFAPAIWGLKETLLRQNRLLSPYFNMLIIFHLILVCW